jgi:succinoglycan biosynthesis protein ExoM
LSPVQVPSVAVAICTYNRPDQLRRLLDLIAVRAPEELPGSSVTVVVVDDSKDGNARHIVEDPSRPCRTLYANTASGNISTARNAAISGGADAAEFVACIDDDCVPEPGWLSESCRVMKQFRADVVVGHRAFVPSDASPKWLHREPFLFENEPYADGSVPVSGNTANVMIRSSWLRQSEVRFRTEMGSVGGEDMVFFADARAAGAEIRFASRSTVLEPCDAKRSTLRYHLWRQMWLGNNEALINHRTRAATRGRLVLRGLRRMASGLTWPWSARRSGSVQWRWGLGRVASGVGLVAGVVGVEMRHRS